MQETVLLLRALPAMFGVFQQNKPKVEVNIGSSAHSIKGIMEPFGANSGLRNIIWPKEDVGIKGVLVIDNENSPLI